MAPTTSLIHLSNATTAILTVTATSTILIVHAPSRLHLFLQHRVKGPGRSPGDTTRQLLPDEEGQRDLHLSPISCMSSLRRPLSPLSPSLQSIPSGDSIIVLAITSSTPSPLLSASANTQPETLLTPLLPAPYPPSQRLCWSLSYRHLHCHPLLSRQCRHTTLLLF
jgi:hypothetical protein